VADEGEFRGIVFGEVERASRVKRGLGDDDGEGEFWIFRRSGWSGSRGRVNREKRRFAKSHRGTEEKEELKN